MTRRDYRILADSFAAAIFRMRTSLHDPRDQATGLATIGYVRATVELALKKDNPRFDVTRFRDAIEEQYEKRIQPLRGPEHDTFVESEQERQNRRELFANSQEED